MQTGLSCVAQSIRTIVWAAGELPGYPMGPFAAGQTGLRIAFLPMGRRPASHDAVVIVQEPRGTGGRAWVPGQRVFPGGNRADVSGVVSSAAGKFMTEGSRDAERGSAT